MPDFTILVLAGFILVISGLLLVLSAILALNEKNERYSSIEEPQERKKVKGGGVILIGPVPVIFGSDKKYAILAIVLAIIIMVLSILFIK